MSSKYHKETTDYIACMLKENVKPYYDYPSIGDARKAIQVRSEKFGQRISYNGVISELFIPSTDVPGRFNFYNHLM